MNANNEAWVESESFITNDRKMIGIEGKIGIYGLDFVGGKSNKYMWHFWGSKDQLTGRFKVTATRENSKEEKEIFSTARLSGPNNGADAHIPSTLLLPDSGLWRLNAYLDDQLFESVYVNVKRN